MTRCRRLCQSREALRVVATGKVVVLIQTGRGWWVMSIERLEGRSGVRFKDWKGAGVLFQMTNMLVVVFFYLEEC